MASKFVAKVRTKLAFWYQNSKAFDYIIMGISLAAFILTWYAVSAYFNTSYLPGPDKVFTALINSFEKPDPATGFYMTQNIMASLGRFTWGFGLALIVAIPIGLLMGSSRIAEAIGRPVVEIFRPIPPIAWVPFFIIILGSVWGPIWTIFLGAFFPILSNVIFGVKSVDATLTDAAKTLGARRSAIFTKVVLPFTVPYIMAGVTIGVGISWMCIVAAEFLGAEGGGVGSYIRVQNDLNNFDYMFAGMVVIALLGLATVGLARLLEKHVSPWRNMK
ncbi:MAG: ABC transporter permease [Methanomassiliicoccales archaeon]|jgi:NitT/TauT family transport system permease protein